MKNFETLIEEVLSIRDLPRDYVEHILLNNGFDERVSSLDEDEALDFLVEEAVFVLDEIASNRSRDMGTILDPDEDED